MYGSVHNSRLDCTGRIQPSVDTSHAATDETGIGRRAPSPRCRSGPWGGPVAGRPRRRRRPSRRTYLAPTHPAVIEKGSPRFTPARRPRSPMFRRRLRTRRQSGREHRTRPPRARGRHSRPPEPAHRRAGGTFRPTRAGHAGTLYANWLLEPETSDELVEDIYMHTLPLAVFAAIQSAPTARVTWPQDDAIAARAMTAAVPPQGGVQ